MPDATHIALRAGHYDINEIINVGGTDIHIGEHTYARGPDKKVNFQCYGGTYEPGAKGITDPAALCGPAVTRHEKADFVKADLGLAKYIAANGNAWWNDSNDFARTTGGFHDRGDSAGRHYAITGVCHQMANSVLTSCGAGRKTLVVWPPSFWATQYAFGHRGTCKPYALPARLDYLLKQYPYPAVAIDPGEVEEMRTLVLNLADDDIRLAQLGELYGTDFLKPGAEGAFMDADRQFRQRKAEADRAIMTDTLQTDAYCDDINAELGNHLTRVADYMRADLAAIYRVPMAAALEKRMMPSREALRGLGAAVLAQ